MKHRILLSFLFWVCALVLPLSAQIDTVFFDDFHDNREEWKVFEDETGHLKIEDGYLHRLTRQRKGHFRLNFQKLSIGKPDTFLYELRIVPQAPLRGGLAFLTFRNGKKQKLGAYTSLFVDKRGSHSYSYTFGDGRFWPNWIDKTPIDTQKPMVLRITFGQGHYNFFIDGVRMGGYKAWRKDPWNEWGWVLKGYNDVKIDYMLLMASQSAEKVR